jgi:hypothetical protein
MSTVQHVIVGVIILGLFLFAARLLWPELSREVDMVGERALQRLDAEDDFSRWEESL